MKCLRYRSYIFFSFLFPHHTIPYHTTTYDKNLGTLKLAARVVQWQRKSGKEAQNQHWFYENGFIANVYNSRLVLDIDGDGSKDGAKIAIGERKSVNNADQKCKLFGSILFLSAFVVERAD